MPDMTQHESTRIVKALCLGNSGSGKTGALSSLVDAGLKLRVIDFDNGLSPISGYVKKRELLKNVSYITCKDNFGFAGDRVNIKKATAFQEAMNALQTGAGMGEGIGGIATWDETCVAVIDTLALAGRAALFNVMHLNGRGAAAPQIQDYGTAMENLERLLDMLTADDVKCHVIVNTHTFTTEGTMQQLPEALGSKLPPKVGKVFDNMISLSVTGGKRTFKTKTDGILALKTAKPIDPTYDIEDGWAKIFKALTGKATLV